MAVPSSGPPLLLYHTCPHTLSAVGATRIMPACADLELCKLPNRPLGEKDGHGCRLGCGGRLHGICGEPEEEGGREIHRVCNPFIAKKPKTPDSLTQPERASKAVEEWAGIEEQAEFADTLSKDAEEIFMEKANNTYEEEADSDDELDNATVSESAEGGGNRVPPSFAELGELFGPLEQYAESCGIGEAGHYLRKAKMVFFAAHSARPARQMDIRTFADS